MTKQALLRLNVFSLKLICNGSAWGTFTLALKLLFLSTKKGQHNMKLCS